MPPGPKLTSLLKKLSLSVVSTLLFFGAAEWLARTGYTPEKANPSSLFEYDKDKVYRLRPNLQSRFARKRVVTNSLGQRDSEIPIRKPAGTTRILVLGDSITFGHGVEAGQAFTERLERKLQVLNRPRRFDVINAGVPGNATFQEYFDLERGLALGPDLVILQFTLNDVTEPYQVYKRFGGKGKDYHGIEDVPYFDYLLSRNSAFYLFLKEMIGRLEHGTADRSKWRQKEQKREIYKAENLVFRPEAPEIVEAWKECLGQLQKIVDTTRKQKIPFVLMATPFFFQLPIAPGPKDPQAVLGRFASQNNIPFIDVLAHLRGKFSNEMKHRYRFAKETPFQEIVSSAKPSKRNLLKKFWSKYYLDYDHFNEEGHKYIADLLYPEIDRVLNPDRKSAIAK